MPETISLMLVAIWLCVGFCVGAGWTLGATVISKVFR